MSVPLSARLTEPADVPSFDAQFSYRSQNRTSPRNPCFVNAKPFGFGLTAYSPYAAAAPENARQLCFCPENEVAPQLMKP